MNRLFIILTFSLLSINSLKAQHFTIDNIDYLVTSSIEPYTVEVTSKNPFYYWYDIVIPEQITYDSIVYKVTSIGDDAFSGSAHLTSVSIPNSVLSIGNDAFYACYGLKSVKIPNSVTSIGEGAFYTCGNLDTVILGNSVKNIGNQAFESCVHLTSIIIPDSVTIIGDNAFSDCYDLTSITIGNLVKTIGAWAFSYCNGITIVDIPNSVENIGEAAFGYCDKLALINVDSGNQNYTSLDGVLYNKNLTTLVKCPGDKTSIEIPNTVITIDPYAFVSSRIIIVELPNSVKKIGERAFSFCSNLTSVIIDNSVTSIGIGVFSDCTNLTSVNLGDSVKSIAAATFNNCTKLKSIILPDSDTIIHEVAFDRCKELESVTIGKSMKSILDYAFYDCPGLKSVTCNTLTPPFLGTESFHFVPKTIQLYVPAMSVNLYSTTNVWQDFSINAIPSNIDFIINGIAYFVSSSIEPNTAEVVRNDSVNYMGEIVIPEKVTYDGIVYIVTAISDSAFYNCTNLISVTIPASVISIENNAFENCNSLTEITCNNLTPPSLGTNVFNGVLKSIPLYVPDESVNTYKTAVGWKEFNINPTSTIEINIESELFIYPNPVYDFLMIDGLKTGTQISVFDLKGNIVYSLFAKSETEKIDFSSVPLGVYFVEINLNEKFKIIKIMKQ
jgi:hypothetical protein